MSTTASHSPLNTSKIGLGSKGPLIGMVYGESNGHMTDDFI